MRFRLTLVVTSILVMMNVLQTQAQTNPCEGKYEGATVGCNVANQLMVCRETAKGIFVAEPDPNRKCEVHVRPDAAYCRGLVQQWLAQTANLGQCYSTLRCTQWLNYMCNEETKIKKQCPSTRRKWPKTKYDQYLYGHGHRC